ncbi:hypothetical protein BD413DRAFT_560079 [Trametes elegans]|nr:hypothetical protein BD413DRAFT_560079 [Trametes elegans]
MGTTQVGHAAPFATVPAVVLCRAVSDAPRAQTEEDASRDAENPRLTHKKRRQLAGCDCLNRGLRRGKSGLEHYAAGVEEVGALTAVDISTWCTGCGRLCTITGQLECSPLYLRQCQWYASAKVLFIRFLPLPDVRRHVRWETLNPVDREQSLLLQAALAPMGECGSGESTHEGSSDACHAIRR